MNGNDLSKIFSLRESFTIIALTGRNGSGYNEIAQQLSKGFNDGKYQKPDLFDLRNNSYKKYRIIYKYIEKNYSPFYILKYRDVLTLCILQYSFDDFINFLKSTQLKEYFNNALVKRSSDFCSEIEDLMKLKDKFESYFNTFSIIDFNKIKEPDFYNPFNSLFFSDEFEEYSKQFHRIFQRISYVKHNILLEKITNNLRKSGNPYKSDIEPDGMFSIAEIINSIIKSYRIKNGTNVTKIVIDSFRNPLELMYFRQRYAAFYIVAVNREDKEREDQLKVTYGSEYNDVSILLEEEYKGGKGNAFYKQYVRECIEKADIHISFRNEEDATELNKAKKDQTSPYFSWKMQLLKYLSLIDHPGLITPSPEERCMQMAITAKYNSGCISRQVGATITDENYSIKAIGWNNTPQGQVPCLLRNAETLIEKHVNTAEGIYDSATDLSEFTPYEIESTSFGNSLVEHYKDQITINQQNLKGRNVCFCFKSLQNSCVEGKNQVHTRSLHAEESAFLQITKYGGTAINNGKLFTTASPCELCSKKAYQLGIKVIYYIDPYPGISKKQILEAGNNKPELRLFNGAIGNAYHWLYEPLMSYKDELSLILGQDIKDKLSILEIKLAKLQKDIEEKEAIINDLRSSHPGV